jgi:uncharacterized protein with HEPN domain
MSNRTDQEFVSDIRGAIQRIILYTTGMDYDAFVADVKTQDAVIRNLEILGEATKNLSEQFCAEWTGIPWKSMAGTRDRLIHQYFGVNLDIVWQMVTTELPAVANQLPSVADGPSQPTSDAG